MRALILVVLCGAFVARAQSVPPPTSRPVLLKAAKLFDGKNERLATPGYLVVQGEKIVAAGARVTVPEGAQVLDLGDATLLASPAPTAARSQPAARRC